MNKWRGIIAYMISVLIASVALGTAESIAEQIHLTDTLSRDDAKCLLELLGARYSYHGDHSAEISELSRSAKVGRASLSDRKYKAYIFLFENTGWCGSAGCLLIVGEKRSDSHCHLLYESDGTEKAIEALRRRDHGYRRLYTPCEARFDGREYRQIHWNCPTIDIQR